MNYKNTNTKIISSTYIFLSILLAIVSSIQPYLLKNIIDNYNNISIIKTYILLYGISIISIIGFEFGIKLLLLKLTVSMKNIMISQIINFIEEDESLFKNHDYLADINVDINTNIEDFINDYYINKLDIFILIINILIYSFAISNLDFVLVLLILVPNILTLFVPYFFKSKIEYYKNKNIELNKNFNSKIIDYTLGINVLRNMFATYAFKNVVDESLDKNLGSEMKLGKLESKLEILIGLISYLGLFILIGYGSLSIYHNMMTVGAFIAAIQFSDIIINPLIRLITSINILSSGRAAYNTIERRYDNRNIKGKELLKIKEPNSFKSLVIDNLKFSYADNLMINISNIKISKSDKILIKGNNGSGKSTLLRIITGNIKDYDGSIYLNGYKLNELNNDYINRYFSIIDQDQYIFNISVDDNVSLYSPVSFSDFKEILDLIQYDAISKTDKTSQSLSGGEKQRVALLRALIRNKEILVIDEGLNQVQKDLRNEILKFLLNDKNLTFIYVSHDIDVYADDFDLVIDMNRENSYV